MAKKIDVWTYNFAKNKNVREAVESVFRPKLKGIRNDRAEVEQEWLRYYNMWNVIHDDSHTYNGRAKLYIPEVRKNVEAQARTFVDAAFPSDDFMECVPGEGGTARGASMQKSIRRWQIEQAHLRLKYHVFARQEVLYGTSPAYVCWTEKVEYAFRSARDPKTGKIKPTRKLIELFKGPDFVVRDLFKWYALNPKKSDILDDGCVDFYPVDLEELRRREKRGQLFGIESILKGNSDAFLREQLEKDVERAESLGLQIRSNQGYSGTASLVEADEERSGTHMVATVYTRVICPEACLEGEDPSLPIPFKIEIYDDEHVGFAGRNPFFHQRPPYVVGKYLLENPDEFYGQGQVKAVQYQQYELNSKAEQAMDSVTLALNPLAFIDPAMAAQGGNYEVEPGGIWWVNPAGVKLAAMPDVSATGYQAMANIRAQMQDYSDRNPSLPAQLQGKSRTATQSEIVDRVMSIDHKTFQIQNEIMVLQPLMEMWESLTDQNGEEDQMIMILGRDATDWKRAIVSKNMTLGNYRYFWRCASTLSNKQIQARQVLDAIKVAASFPPGTLRVDLNEMYRTFCDLQDLPNLDKIVPDLNMQANQQDPEVVYKMIKLGMEVEVLPGDDDEAFIRFFDDALKREKDQATKEILVRQILLHQKQLQAKRAALQQQIQQKQLMLQQMQAQQQGGGDGPQGGGASGGAQGSGNRTQLSPNANAGDMGSGVRA
jgi:hypothetical protein